MTEKEEALGMTPGPPAGAITVYEPVFKDPIGQYNQQLLDIEQTAKATAEDYQKTFDAMETDRVNILNSKTTQDQILELRNNLSTPPQLWPEPSSTEIFLTTVGVASLIYFLWKGKFK